MFECPDLWAPCIALTAVSDTVNCAAWWYPACEKPLPAMCRDFPGDLCESGI